MVIFLGRFIEVEQIAKQFKQKLELMLNERIKMNQVKQAVKFFWKTVKFWANQAFPYDSPNLIHIFQDQGKWHWCNQQLTIDSNSYLGTSPPGSDLFAQGIKIALTLEKPELKASKVKHSTVTLPEKEKLFQSLFEQAGIGMAIADLKGKFVTLNQSFCQIFGYEEQELQGKTFGDLSLPTTNGEEQLFSPSFLEDKDKNQNTTNSLERLYLHKEGYSIWSKVTISLVRDEFGYPQYYLAVVEDIGDRKQSEAILQASLEEKVLLMKEMHHRIKNNLHMLHSLLEMQCRKVKDKKNKNIILSSQKHLQVIALIHEKLYQSDTITKINFAELSKELVANFLAIASVNFSFVELDIDIQPLQLNVKKAIPCSLILNELLTNSFQHAFPDLRPGKIWVKFYQDGEGKVHLNFKDNGVGLPKDFYWDRISSFGMKLIHMLAKQLDGKLEIHSDCGTEFHLTFTTLC